MCNTHPLSLSPPSPWSQERQTALENMGISIQESGIGVQSDKYYLVNLNADPSMNELLVCYLKVSLSLPLFSSHLSPPSLSFQSCQYNI